MSYSSPCLRQCLSYVNILLTQLDIQYNEIKKSEEKLRVLQNEDANIRQISNDLLLNLSNDLETDFYNTLNGLESILVTITAMLTNKENQITALNDKYTEQTDVEYAAILNKLIATLEECLNSAQ